MAAGLMGQLVTPELPSSPKRRLHEEATRGCQVCWSEFGLKGREQRQKDLGSVLGSNLHISVAFFFRAESRILPWTCSLAPETSGCSSSSRSSENHMQQATQGETRVGMCAFGSYLTRFPLFPRGFSPSGFPAVGSGPPSAPVHRRPIFWTLKQG